MKYVLLLHVGPHDAWISLLSHSVEGQSLGLHIAEGVAGTNKGHDMKGVFVKDIIAGTPACSSKK